MRHSLLFLRDDLLPIVSPSDEIDARESTVLVNCKTVLIADRHGHLDEREDSMTTTFRRKASSLTFHPGEGFCIVGWIERVLDEVCSLRLPSEMVSMLTLGRRILSSPRKYRLLSILHDTSLQPFISRRARTTYLISPETRSRCDARISTVKALLDDREHQWASQGCAGWKKYVYLRHRALSATKTNSSANLYFIIFVSSEPLHL